MNQHIIFWHSCCTLHSRYLSSISHFSSHLFSSLLFSSLLFSSLLYSTLLYSTLLYSTLLCSTLLYSTLLFSSLLFSSLLFSSLLFSSHIISYHIISYHIISYHIISYHIISYRISHVLFHPIPSFHWLINLQRHKTQDAGRRTPRMPRRRRTSTWCTQDARRRTPRTSSQPSIHLLPSPNNKHHYAVPPLHATQHLVIHRARSRRKTTHHAALARRDAQQTQHNTPRSTRKTRSRNKTTRHAASLQSHSPPYLPSSPFLLIQRISRHNHVQHTSTSAQRKSCATQHRARIPCAVCE